MIAFGRPVGNLGVTAATLEDLENKPHPLQNEWISQAQVKAATNHTINLTQKTASIIPDETTQSPSQSKSATPSASQPASRLEHADHPLVAPSTLSHPTGTDKVTNADAQVAHPNAGDIDAGDIQPDSEIQQSSMPLSRPIHHSHLPKLAQSFQSFKVDSSALPDSGPNTTTAKVKAGQYICAPSPQPMQCLSHIPIRVRGRLLIRNLRNISSEVRTHKTFYNAASLLKQHRRVPRPDAIAWNQRTLTQTSPQGKPANGFVIISSVFGKRPNPFGRGIEFHNGIDLVGAKGIPILATAGGRVVSRRRGRGYGIHVVVDHGSGYETLYAHLSKKQVKPNQIVKRGQIIGYLGSTGRSTGPHLHYSVYLNRRAVDPRPYIFR